jgi:hypothetical protein
MRKFIGKAIDTTLVVIAIALPAFVAGETYGAIQQQRRDQVIMAAVEASNEFVAEANAVILMHSPPGGWP